MNNDRFKKGDIFHDGFADEWIFEINPDFPDHLSLIKIEYWKDKTLVPEGFNPWYDITHWNLDHITISGNYYNLSNRKKE